MARRPARGWGFAVGLLFFGLSGVFTAIVVVLALRSDNRGELAPWINGIQAGAGLFLAAILAATALAEERVRGSLDVLLATPLSTRSIVLGKWWGAFRVVPTLAILPGLLAAVLAWRSPDRWPLGFLVIGLILAYGAALASLGLALATWVRQLGRAVALTVTAHVVVTVGWTMLCMTQFHHGDFGRCLAEASPFFGVGMLTAMIMGGGTSNLLREHCVWWAAGWVVFYLAVALGLLGATLATFDRSLGRVKERSR